MWSLQAQQGGAWGGSLRQRPALDHQRDGDSLGRVFFFNVL